MELPTSAVKKVRTLIKEGKKLTDVCQRNIKIADRSEHSWAMVLEYENELADHSDDEKRLFRAKARELENTLNRKVSEMQGGEISSGVGLGRL